MKLFYVFCFVFIIGTMNACQTVTYNGETQLQDRVYKNLTINGHAKMSNITVEHLANFSSSIEAKNSNFNEIDSRAHVKCTNCVINNLEASSMTIKKGSIGEAVIKNNVNVSDASVKELTFSGAEAELKNSKIGSIKNTGYTKKRVVILIDTEVSGDITFESTESCQVLLKGNSTVQGKIINAETVN